MALELLMEAEDRAPFVVSELALLEKTYSKAYPGLFLNAEVGLISNDQIQILNNVHRDLDKPTDVLSFPTFNSFEDLEKAAKEIPSLMGSVVISPEKAREYKERLIDLVHHGLLHLLGFDHETQRVQWDEEEKRILAISAEAGLVLKGIPHDSI
jgi:rRNA maturation RNase YbeY